MSGTISLIVVCMLVTAVLGLWLYGERWRPIRPSTWRLVRQSGLRRLLNLTTLHAYIYSRWLNQYVKLGLALMHANFVISRLGSRTKKWIANEYHAKVLTQEEAISIITVDQEVHCDLEQIVPYSMARDLVLKGPPDVAVYECACRHARANPCQPTQVCIVIGQPFVDFILEHHPQTSRRMTQTEAVELIRSEHERGHLQTAWFKHAELGRFYAICNCCKCCCAGIEAMMKHGIPMVASSGYVAHINEGLCTSCGNCVDACIFGALYLGEVARVNWEKCMGCGVCAGQCPSEAITLARDEKKGVPLDVRLLARG